MIATEKKIVRRTKCTINSTKIAYSPSFVSSCIFAVVEFLGLTLRVRFAVGIIVCSLAKLFFAVLALISVISTLHGGITMS